MFLKINGEFFLKNSDIRFYRVGLSWELSKQISFEILHIFLGFEKFIFILVLVQKIVLQQVEKNNFQTKRILKQIKLMTYPKDNPNK